MALSLHLSNAANAVSKLHASANTTWQGWEADHDMTSSVDPTWVGQPWASCSNTWGSSSR
jgi:hypothetical protein